MRIGDKEGVFWLLSLGMEQLESRAQQTHWAQKLRRCAILQNSNIVLRDVYWIRSVSRLVICAVDPCFVHRTWRRLAGWPHLNMILLELWQSEIRGLSTSDKALNHVP